MAGPPREPPRGRLVTNARRPDASGLRVPGLERVQRIEGDAAPVPGTVPELEVQMAAVGAPGVADVADQRPGPHAVTRVDERGVAKVHVDVVHVGARAVDDDVIPGATL